MKYFQLIGNIDPLPTLAELIRQPHLWGQNDTRTTYENTPHGDISDIWVRCWPGKVLDSGTRKEMEFLPAWYALPSLRPLVFAIMTRMQAVELGVVMLTKIPPGKQIKLHIDKGWQADWFNTKVYCVLQGNDNCWNVAEDERVVMQTGSAWIFRNDVVHGLVNEGLDDRISAIICMRVES